MLRGVVVEGGAGVVVEFVGEGVEVGSGLVSTFLMVWSGGLCPGCVMSFVVE